MKNFLVTLFRENFKLFSTHNERARKLHSEEIDRQIMSLELRRRSSERVYLLLDLPEFECTELFNRMRHNFETFGLVAKYGILLFH